jgi:hypothetical protein
MWKAFVSSFAGDVNAMRSTAGRAIMFVPNFHPGNKYPVWLLASSGLNVALLRPSDSSMAR